MGQKEKKLLGRRENDRAKSIRKFLLLSDKTS